MRVLVVNRYWKRYGGVEEVVHDTAAVLESRGHEVIPFAMAAPDNWPSEWSRFFPSNVEFHESGAAGRRRGALRAIIGRDARRDLSALLDAVRIDVAHVFSVYHYLGTGVLAELGRRHIPVILSLHDYKVGCPNVALYSDRTRRPCTVCLDRPLGFVWAPPLVRCRLDSVGAGFVLAAEAVTAHARGAYRRVPAVVTVLNTLQRRAAERAGIDPERIHHVPNFFNLGDPAPSPRDRAVLYVGRLTAEKGVDVLIDACARSGLPVRIVGDGPARRELEALAQDRGADAVFTGALARADALDAMRRAGVVAVPSRWPDVAPLVVGEAWSTGTPVVGSDLGGLGELLADDRGVRCLAGDPDALGVALRRVLDNPGWGDQLVERARDYARAELSRDRWLERMGRVYGAVGATL
jgi:glycosyltransferase involved in cell wall biosynthesis